MSILDHIWPFKQLRAQAAYIDRLNRTYHAEVKAHEATARRKVVEATPYMRGRPLNSDELSKRFKDEVMLAAAAKLGNMMHGAYADVLRQIILEAPQYNPHDYMPGVALMESTCQVVQIEVRIPEMRHTFQMHGGMR